MFFGYMGAVDGMGPSAISEKIKNNLWTSVSFFFLFLSCGLLCRCASLFSLHDRRYGNGEQRGARNPSCFFFKHNINEGSPRFRLSAESRSTRKEGDEVLSR